MAKNLHLGKKIRKKICKKNSKKIVVQFLVVVTLLAGLILDFPIPHTNQGA
jgi:hypothetical protein